MNELTNVHLVASFGFALAAVFGFVANKTSFCVMGAISDVLHMGSRGRLGAWFLAIGIAIVGAQGLQLSGYVDLNQSLYLNPSFGWLGNALGGFMFGVGMTLAGGCGQRNLVRLGGGNLKAFVVLTVLGLSAYMTVRGVLALIRVNVVSRTSIDLSEGGLQDQSLVSAVVGLTGFQNAELVRIVLAALLGLGFIVYALRQPGLRESFDNLLAGITVGALVIAAWFVTGYVGQDDFDPVPVEGLTFVAPTGNAINYLMTFTGATINFGIAVVAGMFLGSLVYAALTGNFRIETFSNRADMMNHLVGAALMGFGGVLALGCTIGQGVTGMSTLAMGSAIAMVSIIFGSALTMKIQYHMLDERGFFSALVLALAELFALKGNATQDSA
ncbi:MAG: YeeE/YedE family protein [Gammaproteobacteria bacterium]